MKADNVDVQRIEPEEAATHLKNKARNRPLRRRLLDRLEDDLRHGRWRLTGEPIIFDNYGRLIDGQHRLQACVNTGIPIDVYVVKGGIADDAQGHIDTGIARHPGESLYIVQGTQQANRRAATLRWIFRFENDDLEFGIKQLSRQTLFEMSEKMPDLERSFNSGNKVKKFLPPSLTTAMHYLMHQKDPMLADVFFDEICTGAVATQNDPVFLLREMLIRNKLRQSRYSVYHMTALTIKAWNALRAGKRDMRRLAWYPASGEAFPQIK